MDPSGQPRQALKPRESVERYTLPARGGFDGSEHMRNFIECVRSRQAPRETAQMGMQAAWAAQMANLAYQHRTLVTWDEKEQRPHW